MQKTFHSNLIRLLCFSFIMLNLFFSANATDRYVPVGGSPAYPDIQSAINASSAGDVIHVASGIYVITGTINVNKSVTIDGGSSLTTLFQISGSANLFLINAPNCVIRNLEISKTDISFQEIVSIQANNFELANTYIHALYYLGSIDPTTRGLVLSPGYTGVNIHDNRFKALRQPGYINGASGVINNNLVEITRGWVVVSQATVSFNGNTWGSGANVNATDIAIIPDSPEFGNNYTDIVSMSAANYDAIIENKHSSYGSPILSIVHVDQTAAAGGDGTIPKPYNTITPAISRIATSGKILVASGNYNESLIINKKLNLRGANFGIPCSESRGSESIINGLGGSGNSAINVNANNVTIDGFTITNPSGSYGVSQNGRSNFDVEHNIITNIGNNLGGSGSTWAVNIEAGTSLSGVTVLGNCINNIRGGVNTSLTGAAAKANNGSGGAVLIASTNSPGNVSSVNISNNIIDHISASNTSFANGGKGAYGIQLNVGASGIGSIQSPLLLNNEINFLQGLWSHGIGLEGRTPGAIISNNNIHDLIDNKGNTDADGVRIEDNSGAGTLSIYNNSFTNLAYGISNVTSSTVNGPCNWFGSSNTVLVTSSIEGAVTYIPYLSNGSDNSTAIGFQPVPNSCNGQPVPSISFTASSNSGSQTTTAGAPSDISVHICSGGNFTLSGFDRSPGNRVGSLEKLYSSNLSGIPSDRPQSDISPSSISAFFNNTYGPYNLNTGVSNGTIDQIYTPYYDADGSNSYTTGDILGTPVTLHYYVYRLTMGACSKSDANCNAGTGSVTAGNVTGANGMLNYVWRNSSNVIVGTGSSVNNLPAGIYSLTVTDNCTSLTCSVTINQPSPISVNYSFTPILCHGGLSSQTIMVTGGTAPYSVANQGGGLLVTGLGDGQTFSSPNSTYAANYVYTVTDAKGCTKVFTVNITEPSALSGGTISMSPNPTIAGQNPNTIYIGFGAQTVNLNTGAVSGGTAPYTYTLGSTTNSTGIFAVSPVVTTTYTIVIKDAHNCAITRTFTVNVIDPFCDKKPNNQKVYVCHNGNVICVSVNAWPAHQAHGDQLGICGPGTSLVSRQAPEADNESIAKESTPQEYLLSNFPNPFTGKTTIHYELPEDSKVTLTVYSITGKVVASFNESDKKAGRYNFDITTAQIGHGMFYYRLVATGKNNKFIQTNKMITIK